MDDFGFDTAGELREYIAVIKIRKWTVVLATLAILGIALGYSYWQTPIYSASARVLVIPPASDPRTYLAPTLIDTETEVQILSSEPVAALVRDELGLDVAIDSLLDGLRVDDVPGSRVLQLSYSSVDPELARDVTNSFASNYINYRRAQALEIIDSQREAIQNRITATSEELEALATQIRIARQSGDRGLVRSLKDSKNVLLARLGVLQQQLIDVQPDQATLGGGDVIATARLPEEPSSPNHPTNGILGLLLGLPLGIALAFLRERLDDRFRGGLDVEKVLQVPLLGTIPRFKHNAGKPSAADIVVANDPKGLASEAYRSLRTNLQFLLSQRDSKSVVVASPGAGEGKTCTAVNLGTVLAQAGLRVILVSSDLRRPTLEKYFGIDNSRGLSNWLSSSESDLWSYVVNPGIPNLRVLPAGQIPPNPAELLGSQRFADTTKTLEQHCDVLLFDSPPIFPVADPAVIASRIGAVLLVLDPGTTHKSAASRAKQEIERAGGEVIGVMLNGFDPSSSPYYYYESPYHSTYYRRYEEGGEASTNGRRPPFFKRGRRSLSRRTGR